MSIELLTQIDEVTGSTYFAVNINGQDYRVGATAVLGYMQANITFPDSGFETQYAAPSSSGFSVQITDNSADTHLILTPTGGFAVGTVVLPALSSAVDKQEVLVNCTQAVTAFAVNGNGSTVTGAPVTLAANAFFRMKFDAVTSTWYRVG